MLTCPRCGAAEPRRSHRRGELERLLSCFGWYPFRCMTCQYRFRARWPEGQETPDRGASVRQGGIGGALLVVGAWMLFVVAAGLLMVVMTGPDVPQLDAPHEEGLPLLRFTHPISHPPLHGGRDD